MENWIADIRDCWTEVATGARVVDREQGQKDVTKLIDHIHDLEIEAQAKDSDYRALNVRCARLEAECADLRENNAVALDELDIAFSEYQEQTAILETVAEPLTLAEILCLTASD